MVRILSLSLLLVPLSLIIGCSGEETGGPDAEVKETVESAVDAIEQEVEKRVGPQLDLSYITDDFSSAVIVHPGRMLNSDFVNELVKAGLPLEEALKEPMEEFGIDPRNVEQIMVLLDKETAAMAPMMLPFGGPPGGDPGDFGPEFELEVPDTERIPLEKEESDQGAISTPSEPLQTVAFQPEGVVIEEEFGEGPGEFGPEFAGPPMPTVIVRFSEAVNADEFFENLNGPPLEDAEIDGLKVKKNSFPEGVFHFVDSKTLIVTRPDYLKKMVDTKSADSALITELKKHRSSSRPDRRRRLDAVSPDAAGSEPDADVHHSSRSGSTGINSHEDEDGDADGWDQPRFALVDQSDYGLRGRRHLSQ